MPSTLRLECATCGESAAVLNPGTRLIADLTCPACGEQGTLRENASISFAPVEHLPLVEPEPPLVSSCSVLARRRRGSGFAFLVRMLVVFALGGLLAQWIWQEIGAPRIELHKDVDGSVKEIRVVPTN